MSDALIDVVSQVMIATEFADEDIFAAYTETSGSDGSLVYTFELYDKIAVVIQPDGFFLAVLDDTKEAQVICNEAVEALILLHGEPEEITCDKDGATIPVWRYNADMGKLGEHFATLKKIASEDNPSLGPN